MQKLIKSSSKVKNSVEAFAACLCQCKPNCFCCTMYNNQPTAIIQGSPTPNVAGITASRATIMGDTGIGS